MYFKHRNNYYTPKKLWRSFFVNCLFVKSTRSDLRSTPDNRDIQEELGRSQGSGVCRRQYLCFGKPTQHRRHCASGGSGLDHNHQHNCRDQGKVRQGLTHPLGIFRNPPLNSNGGCRLVSLGGLELGFSEVAACSGVLTEIDTPEGISAFCRLELCFFFSPPSGIPAL